MTCHDARELFSGRVDDALAAAEHAELEAHLAGCAECRRELARFEGTVALLREVPPARAPVGFVDRVLAAARPVPWYVRLGRRLVQPLAWRVPLEATVVVLVGITAVYLYERSPELQQAARPAPSYPLSTRAAPPAPAPAAPAPGSRAVAPTAPPVTATDEEREFDRARRQPAETPGPTRRDQFERAPSLTGRLADAPSADAPSAPPASPGPAERQAAARSETGAREQAAKRALGPASAAGTAATAPVVTGRLSVDDPPAADVALRELLARVGATEVARRGEGGALVLEIVLPGAAYPEFAAGLARIGRWHPEGVPSQIPRELRLSLRLGD